MGTPFHVPYSTARLFCPSKFQVVHHGMVSRRGPGLSVKIFLAFYFSWCSVANKKSPKSKLRGLFMQGVSSWCCNGASSPDGWGGDLLRGRRLHHWVRFPGLPPIFHFATSLPRHILTLLSNCQRKFSVVQNSALISWSVPGRREACLKFEVRVPHCIGVLSAEPQWGRFPPLPLRKLRKGAPLRFRAYSS